MSFTDVAGVVGRSPAAVRQLASRARQHVDGGRPSVPAHPSPSRRILVTAFAAACAGGDLEGLVTLLDPDVEWRADGGGKVTATRQTGHGAGEVARWLLGIHCGTRRPWSGWPPSTAGPGLVVRDGGGVLTVVSFTIDRGRITALDVIRNPDKLAALRELAD